MNTITTDILIIGAGPAGLVAAATANANYPEKQITIIKEFEKAQVPCGIPYVFGKTLGDVEKNAMPCGGPVANITTIVDKVLSVDIKTKTATASQHAITFEKLIFATGSIPFVHDNFVDSVALPNVFVIEKSYDEVKRLQEYIKDKK
ncbi:MAG: FAD/NAD(P)-binding oxidoreductase, partial [Sulfurimonadaceae bacterium]|nr:FAD/NAD(P)-binding oxidoreductase [Sulfurimonadaceae bacterium]